jgi:iron only hydrogenase large subunit-like protein
MSFVKLENLNDFIEPSSKCIKPIEKKPAGVVAKVSDINLSDCLACSGCITSAETVLVQQQTHEELFKVINDCKSSKVSTSYNLQRCLTHY